MPTQMACKRNAPAWKQSYFLKAVFRPPQHKHTRAHTQTRAHTKTHAPGPAGATVPGTPCPAPARPPPAQPPSPSASKQLLTWVRQSGEYITAGRWGVRVRLGVRFGGVRECG